MLAKSFKALQQFKRSFIGKTYKENSFDIHHIWESLDNQENFFTENPNWMDFTVKFNYYKANLPLYYLAKVNDYQVYNAGFKAQADTIPYLLENAILVLDKMFIHGLNLHQQFKYNISWNCPPCFFKNEMNQGIGHINITDYFFRLSLTEPTFKTIFAILLKHSNGELDIIKTSMRKTQKLGYGSHYIAALKMMEKYTLDKIAIENHKVNKIKVL